jgi:hypothetical protein
MRVLVTDSRAAAGYMVFLVLVAIAGAAAWAAYNSTGAQGIEERFENALGLSPDGDHLREAEDGIAGHSAESGEDEVNLYGFSVEGNPVLYLLVLVLLAAGSFLAYKKFRI